MVSTLSITISMQAGKQRHWPYMIEAIRQAANTRNETIRATSEERRIKYAQHLTPPETATLAASMFSGADRPMDCLDLGAGTGMLTAALIARYSTEFISRMDAVEIDPVLADIYRSEIGAYGIHGDLVVGDAITETPERQYDRIILNPPYKKMAAADPRQKELPCPSANLYSAFLAVALTHLKDEGEVVAIVPRSWTNGDYFTPFRNLAFGGETIFGPFSLDMLHVYGSRTEVFADTDVLQETMLVRFSRRPQVDHVVVSQSVDKETEPKRVEYDQSDIICGDTHVVRIAPSEQRLEGTIETVGLCPSTGKVVDFRSRERTYTARPDTPDAYRLIYARNFAGGVLTHPADIGKCQWYVADDDASRRQLIEPGCYVVVKRFSSKEERRRVVAFPLVTTEKVALENHTNYIHQGTRRKTIPLRSENLACGIAIWLNSTYVDEWFRDVSGSTQVNASDIRKMPCPTLKRMERLGNKWRADLTQDEIDELSEAMMS